MTDILNSDTARCNNFMCNQRQDCKRYLQNKIDKKNNKTNDYYWVLTDRFNEIGCKEFIRKKRS